MNITEDSLTTLLRSGKCVLINSEEMGLKIPDSDPSNEDHTGIRLELIGTIALSDTRLVLVIKDHYVVGTAMLSDDQYQYLGQRSHGLSGDESFDTFLFRKWQDEKYGS